MGLRWRLAVRAANFTVAAQGVLDCDARRRLHWRFAVGWWSV